MTIARIHKLSLTFYQTVLGLTIPFYFLLYGASGHQFNIPAREQLWLLIVVVSFALTVLYTRVRKKEGSNIGLRLLFTISLIGTFYGGIKAFLFMVTFEFGNDVGLFVRGVSYLMPLAFSISCGVVFIGV